ncbi:hypothetical protein ACS0TY_007234 [Phlomoides rotata]
MDANRERELFGPIDDSVLNKQDTHRSRMISINRDHNETLLQLFQGSQNVFWTFKTTPGPDDFVLHPRVLDRLQVMGFYGPARCGSIRLDRHLITALVERWRPETHTFHFPIGETTITLQDVAILWGLSIEGEPIICREPHRTKTEWRQYCLQWLGFQPQESEMRSKTAILLSALSDRLKHRPDIDMNTPQDVVDQYARGCALILLGGLMMPNSSRCSVSLLYLQFLENVTKAGEYSWGSAVLAVLYRELCTTSQAEKTTIAGALSLLQIWAWSRINVIQPLKVRDMIVAGTLLGADNRDLGLPPYGVRWIHYNDHTRSVSNTIRVYRDIFDRLSPEQFIWEPYDMTLPDIATLGPRCLTENWMSECPLISVGIVEIHYPNRVLRQFGMIQGIPNVVHSTHASLHDIDRRGKEGYDWVSKHAHWITYWRDRSPFTPAMPINGGVTLTDDYMQWYYRITRRLISPDQYTAEVGGFQPLRTSTRDVLVIIYLNIHLICFYDNMNSKMCITVHLFIFPFRSNGSHVLKLVEIRLQLTIENHWWVCLIL